MRSFKPIGQLFTLAEEGGRVVIRRHAVRSNRTFGPPITIGRAATIGEAMKLLPRQAHRIDNRPGPADRPDVIGCFMTP